MHLYLYLGYISKVSSQTLGKRIPATMEFVTRPSLDLAAAPGALGGVAAAAGRRFWGELNLLGLALSLRVSTSDVAALDSGLSARSGLSLPLRGVS